jgi:hypothetical protein
MRLMIAALALVFAGGSANAQDALDASGTVYVAGACMPIPDGRLTCDWRPIQEIFDSLEACNGSLRMRTMRAGLPSNSREYVVCIKINR